MLCLGLVTWIVGEDIMCVYKCTIVFENWAWCLVKPLSKSLLCDISNELDLQTIKFISLMTGIWCLYHCHVMSWTLWVLLDTETSQHLTTTYAPLTSKVRQSHLVTKIGTSPNFCPNRSYQGKPSRKHFVFSEILPTSLTPIVPLIRGVSVTNLDPLNVTSIYTFTSEILCNEAFVRIVFEIYELPQLVAMMLGIFHIWSWAIEHEQRCIKCFGDGWEECFLIHDTSVCFKPDTAPIKSQNSLITLSAIK